MARSNHSILGEGLRLYTNGMGRFFKQRLEAAFGGAWWEEGVIKKRSYEGSRQLERDMAKNPRADKVTFLDPGIFVDIVIRNHALFQDIFPNRREVRALLVQISEARNRWAHYLGSSDLTEDDVILTLMTMEKLLSDAGLPQSGYVKRLRMEMGKTDPVSEAQVFSPTQTPEPEIRKERLAQQRRVTLTEVVRQEVIDHWFIPARNRGEREVTVAARDINKRLGWSQRYPSICSALSDRNGELARRANVQLIHSSHPNPSSTTKFVYRML